MRHPLLLAILIAVGLGNSPIDGQTIIDFTLENNGSGSSLIGTDNTPPGGWIVGSGQSTFDTGFSASTVLGVGTSPSGAPPLMIGGAEGVYASDTVTPSALQLRTLSNGTSGLNNALLNRFDADGVQLDVRAAFIVESDQWLTSTFGTSGLSSYNLDVNELESNVSVGLRAVVRDNGNYYVSNTVVTDDSSLDIMLGLPGIRATEHRHLHSLLFDEDVFFESGQLLIGKKLFPSIQPLCRGREDFDQCDRFRFVILRVVRRIAGHQEIGIIEDIVFGNLQPELHVRRENPAWFSLEVRSQSGIKISRDEVVRLAPAGHGIDPAADVFVTDIAHLLALDIFVGREEARCFREAHGGKVDGRTGNFKIIPLRVTRFVLPH